jgi:hypothetical protein
MILSQNVTLILCVCKLEEGRRPKCHKYWPDGSSSTDIEFKGMFSDIDVKTVSEKALSKFLYERVFEVN